MGGDQVAAPPSLEARPRRSGKRETFGRKAWIGSALLPGQFKEENKKYTSKNKNSKNTHRKEVIVLPMPLLIL